MALVLKHQTTSEFMGSYWAKIQKAYRNRDMWTVGKLITWIWEKVQVGDLTNDQMRQSFNTAFGRNLTLSQWNTFVTTRIIPIKDRYIAMRDETEL
jgi:hypothetical protein